MTKGSYSFAYSAWSLMRIQVLGLFFVICLNSCLGSTDAGLQDVNALGAGREDLYFSSGTYQGEATLRPIDGTTINFFFTATIRPKDLEELNILSSPDRQSLATISRKSLEDDWTLNLLEKENNWLAQREPLPFLSIAALLSLPKSAIDEQWNTFLNIQNKAMEVHLKHSEQQIDVQVVQADFLLSLVLKKDNSIF